MDKIKLDWNKYQECINLLIKKIKASGKVYDGIYGISRGGMCIAISLSHALNIPITLYPHKATLIVNDISDTGKTLLSHKDRDILTIYSSAWTEVVPEFFVFTKREKTHWIVFPYEVDEQGKEQ